MNARAAVLQRVAGRPDLTARQRERLLGYALILPAFAFILGLIAYPAGWAIYLSFTSKVVGQAERWVGLRNYEWVLGWPDFGLMIRNTIVLVVVGVAVKALVGMTMALALNEQFPARALIRALLFLPWTVPTFVAGLIWRWLFDDQNGLFNWVLLNLGLIQSPIPFLGSFDLAMPAVITVVVWKGFPFFGISYLAGLQAIPSEQYEAAEVDGANALQRFWYITLPGLKHVVLVTVMLSTIWTANTFDLVYLMTNGGPSNATEVFTMLTYELGIRNGRIGEAATVPMMAMPVFAGLIVVLTRYLQERGGEA
jgi:ABC-type sugar transport system permease subunit